MTLLGFFILMGAIAVGVLIAIPLAYLLDKKEGKKQ